MERSSFFVSQEEILVQNEYKTSNEINEEENQHSKENEEEKEYIDWISLKERRSDLEGEIEPVARFNVRSYYFNCFYSSKTKHILTFDNAQVKAVLLNKDFNVIHTSDFPSCFHLATVEINHTLLYSMHDGADSCIALVHSDNLQLLDK